ncbi:hypothetical protein [Aureibacter tunicatorum]|uniref:Neuromedin U n=1 Tax=Aureibacter tunicatorum TaxID=866807 RepID=A0AAE3XMG8_9BACT|nr:hypothetical protein [Aureibacter tunicatorum]MDR6240621.1 hypothetical protein [Aureibacter tunicatorum]BDD06518.1 hypothetical protein AUTU_40010 [Aureibacter tunicatorum]
MSLFFTPSKLGKFIWGAGPIIQLPTSTSDQVGRNRFGIGPSVVGVVMTGPWVIGGLVNNVWTISKHENFNNLLIQYFVNYNFSHGIYINSAPIITNNWNAEKSQSWVVPFGLNVGKVFFVGKLPLNFSAGFNYNVVKPDERGPWETRFQLQFILPRFY